MTLFSSLSTLLLMCLVAAHEENDTLTSAALVAPAPGASAQTAACQDTVPHAGAVDDCEAINCYCRLCSRAGEDFCVDVRNVGSFVCPAFNQTEIDACLVAADASRTRTLEAIGAVLFAVCACVLCVYLLMFRKKKVYVGVETH